MSEERRVVLQMLRDGRITVEEAEALLDALEEPVEGEDGLQQGVRRAVETVGPALRSALRILRERLRVELGQPGDQAAVTRAAGEVRWSHAAPQGRVVVRNVRGDLVVQNCSDDQVHVEVRGTGEQPLPEEQVVVEPRGEDLVVEVGPSSGQFPADLTLRFPPHTRLDAQVESGDVRVAHVASCTLQVGVGDVAVGRASGSVAVRCGSGDVRIGTVEGDLSVDATSGDVSVERVVGSARVHVASGDVELGGCSGAVVVRLQRGDLDLAVDGSPSVQLEVSSGDVQIHVASLAAEAVAQVHVASGDVALTLDPRVRARIRAQTQRGAVSWDGEAVSRGPGSAEGVVGAADATVSVQVGSGDVVIREGR